MNGQVNAARRDTRTRRLLGAAPRFFAEHLDLAAVTAAAMAYQTCEDTVSARAYLRDLLAANARLLVPFLPDNARAPLLAMVHERAMALFRDVLGELGPPTEERRRRTQEGVASVLAVHEHLQRSLTSEEGMAIAGLAALAILTAFRGTWWWALLVLVGGGAAVALAAWITRVGPRYLAQARRKLRQPPEWSRSSEAQVSSRTNEEG